VDVLNEVVMKIGFERQELLEALQKQARHLCFLSTSTPTPP
jgi:adenosylmethionine-8-amino-7-oxononanoate aminotransferase